MVCTEDMPTRCVWCPGCCRCAKNGERCMTWLCAAGWSEMVGTHWGAVCKASVNTSNYLQPNGFLCTADNDILLT
jgi:hypothetical protein